MRSGSARSHCVCVCVSARAGGAAESAPPPPPLLAARPVPAAACCCLLPARAGPAPRCSRPARTTSVTSLYLQPGEAGALPLGRLLLFTPRRSGGVRLTPPPPPPLPQPVFPFRAESGEEESAEGGIFL